MLNSCSSNCKNSSIDNRFYKGATREKNVMYAKISNNKVEWRFNIGQECNRKMKDLSENNALTFVKAYCSTIESMSKKILELKNCIQGIEGVNEVLWKWKDNMQEKIRELKINCCIEMMIIN